MDNLVLDKIMDTTPIYKNDNIVPVDRIVNAQSFRHGVAGHRVKA